MLKHKKNSIVVFFLFFVLGCNVINSAPVITAPPVEEFKSLQSAPIVDVGNLQWRLMTDGLEFPTDVTNAGDGSGRLFVLEKAGRIRIIDASGKLVEKPFLDIRKRVVSKATEQGLLGLAFHLNYVENGYFFVFYTNKKGDTVLSRFQVSDNANVADSESEVIFLQEEHPTSKNHHGGGLAFGPDGYLYIGKGDGSKYGDPYGASQELTSWLGKILRIDVNGGDTYKIPADNPYVYGGGLPEIWAYGLRNPWRISFDSLTGDFYIADVGHYEWEEVNVVPAGSGNGFNFGWDILEASHAHNGEWRFGLTMPVVEYPHEVDCAVTGGFVYRGQNIPALQGVYLFGDFCSGTIWGLLNSPDGWQTSVLFDTNFTVSSFGLDESGEIYLASFDGGIYKLEKAP